MINIKKTAKKDYNIFKIIKLVIWGKKFSNIKYLIFPLLRQKNLDYFPNKLPNNCKIIYIH